MSGSDSVMLGNRYNIIKKIGEGGMQNVFLAHDDILNRNVALKTPKNQSALKRFHRSAILSSRINHPNVAKTLDYFHADGCEYLTEEFIDGVDLDKAILGKYKYVDPCLTASIFHRLSKALSASHHAGVIHRDLKPSNIMITGGINASEVKITDFGISKMAGDEIDEAAKNGDASITTSQTAMGALPYMAPEIIERPKDVSTQTDVWAIGAIIYKILTGEYPFGNGYRAIPNILLGTPVPYPDFVLGNPQFRTLSSQIIDIITLCFSKNPADRPTADDLVHMCGKLCYSLAPRYFGTVGDIPYGSYGFIFSETGERVFFHFDSVYGETLTSGDEVILSKYLGGGYDRAHPVIKAKG